jgi:hypothetical protein
MSDLIDLEGVAAAEALFETTGVDDAAYKDETPVTITVTKAQAFMLRRAVRADLQLFLGNVQMSDAFGFEPTQHQADDTNQALRLHVANDEALAAVADAAEYPRTEAEPELVGM